MKTYNADNTEINIPEEIDTHAHRDLPIRSIYIKFLTLLIPAVTLCAILVLSVYAYVKTNAAEEAILHKLDFIFTSHAEAIEHPLWTLDLPGLNRVMKTIAIYPEILCVEVLDIGENKKVSWPENCHNQVKASQQHVKPLSYENKIIGTLFLHYTDEPALATLQREIRIGAVFFFVLVIVTCLAAFASLRSIVGRPLMLLMKSIRTAKKVEDHETVDWSSQDEFGEAISAYNSLIVQVNEKTEELINAREEAEMANESKGMFLANMSHELRTPLNTVISITEMLREEAEDENKDTEAFKRVAGSGRHLLCLIDELLQYSKIEADRVEVSLAQLSLSTLINDVLTIARPLSIRKNNTLELIDKSRHESIVSDELKLRQIILNLLGNAIKFTDNGQIFFTIEEARYKNQPGILFSIKDTGIGISEQDQSRVFKEFVQADISTTRQFGGTGLGLTISQRLCNLLGGHISLVSQERKGTEFSFILPVNPLSEQAGAPAANNAERSTIEY